MTRTALLSSPIRIGTVKNYIIAHFIFDGIELNNLNYTSFMWIETYDRALIFEILDEENKKLLVGCRIPENYSGLIKLPFDNPYICCLLTFRVRKENDGGEAPKIFSVTLDI